MNKIYAQLDKLIVFATVAEKGKIVSAAKILHLTQPSISRSIQKLEEAFTQTLFIREREGVRLTPAGNILYIEVQKIMRGLGDAQARMLSPHSGEFVVRLTVGTYESLAEYLWPQFLIELAKLHPEFQLSIKTSSGQKPIADLLSGNIDLLVDAEPQTHSELSSWPLYSDRFAFYVARNAKEPNLDQVLAEQTPIAYVQKTYDEYNLAVEDHLRRNDYQFSREFIFDSFSAAKQMAIKGVAVAVLPTRLADDAVKNKLIKKIKAKGFGVEGFGRHTIYATTLNGADKDVRIKKLISLLKKHFQS